MNMAEPDLLFNGTQLKWKKDSLEKIYPATSGARGTQNPKFQHKEDAAIPTGKYYVQLGHLKKSTWLAGGRELDKEYGIRYLPGAAPEDGGRQLGGWGWLRIRLTKISNTLPANARYRDGFYIHDSQKGYSHGCIEVDGQFTKDIIAYTKEVTYPTKENGKVLLLEVKYTSSDMITNGGTGRASYSSDYWTQDKEANAQGFSSYIDTLRSRSHGASVPLPPTP